jgi:hypothetical protein
MTRLVGRYGDGQVFKDVDSIQLGDDFMSNVRGRRQNAGR